MKIISHFTKTIALTAIILSTSVYSSKSYSYQVPAPSDVLKNFGFPSQQALSKRMNILVWNLHKGEDGTFATDFAELAYKKDLVIGQEMFLSPLMRMIFGSFPQYYFSSATSFFMGDELTRTGVTTASPVLPSSIDFVRTETLEPIVSSPKVSLISRYPIKNTDKTLTVINIHGINFVDNTSYNKEITRIYEAIKKFPSPLIFAGDFNSWNDERNIILSDLCKKLKLREANFFPDHRMRFNKHPLDHFYYTDDLRVIEAKVEDFYQGSDHKPLELIVEYSSEESSLKLAKK